MHIAFTCHTRPIAFIKKTVQSLNHEILMSKAIKKTTHCECVQNGKSIRYWVLNKKYDQ